MFAQILQYIEPILTANFGNENYPTNIINYNEFVFKNCFYFLLNVWMEILLYIVLAIIIFIKRKTFKD